MDNTGNSSVHLPVVLYQQQQHKTSVNQVDNSDVLECSSNFTLNMKRTRAKKRKACDRDNYKIKENKNSSTIIFSTVAFEIFRSKVFTYLQRHSYGYQLTESKDIPGNVTHDILRVFTAANMVSSLYTVNLYRTTSSLLVNGPHYNQFVINHLPQITEYIDRVDSQLRVANHQIKQFLSPSSDISFIPVPNSGHDSEDIPNKMHPKTSKLKITNNQRKRYNTRSRSSYPIDSSNRSLLVDSPDNSFGADDSMLMNVNVFNKVPCTSPETTRSVESDDSSSCSLEIVGCLDISLTPPNIVESNDFSTDLPKIVDLGEEDRSSMPEVSNGITEVDDEISVSDTLAFEPTTIINNITNDPPQVDTNETNHRPVVQEISIPSPSCDVANNLDTRDSVPVDKNGASDKLQNTTNSKQFNEDSTNFEPLQIENRRPKRSTKAPPKYQDHILSSRKESRSTIEKPAELDLPDSYSDPNLLYCMCQQPWNEDDGDNMIFCENCLQWLHYSCIGVDKAKVRVVERFICFQCAMDLFDISEKLKQTQSLLSSENHHLNVQVQELNHTVSTLNENYSCELMKTEALTAENLKLRKEKDTLQSHQEKLNKTIIAHEGTEEAVSAVKDQLVVKEKELKESAKSIEILTKRCSTLEKEKSANIKAITSLEQSVANEISQKVELQNQVESLNKEISSHISINKDILEAQSSNPALSANKTSKPCTGCKDKSDEMKTLKNRICITESTIKDLEKGKISINSELYAAKLELKREKAINDILMKFSETNEAPSAHTESLTEVSRDTSIDQPSNSANLMDSPSDAPEAVNNAMAGPADGNLAHLTGLVNDDDKISPLPSNTTSIHNSDFCESEFDEAGSCPNKQCGKNHNFDYLKLSNGPCIHELRRKNSCLRTSNCRFSHQIPAVRRGDAKLISDTRAKMKPGNNPAQKKVDALKSDVCTTEFYGGKHTCKQEGCKKLKDHDLDFSKVKRGICLFEFFKKDSCTRNTKCHFTHKFPLQCLSDPSVTQIVLNSINKFNNKEKIVEILGKDVVDAAAKCSNQDTHHNVATNHGSSPPRSSALSSVLSCSPGIEEHSQQLGTHYYNVAQQQVSPTYDNSNTVFSHAVKLTPNIPREDNLGSSNSDTLSSTIPQTLLTPIPQPFLSNLIKEMISKELQTHQYRNPGTR